MKKQKRGDFNITIKKEVFISIVIVILVVGLILLFVSWYKPSIENKSYTRGFNEGVVQLALHQTATRNITILVQNDQGEIILPQGNFNLKEYTLIDLFSQVYQQEFT